MIFLYALPFVILYFFSFGLWVILHAVCAVLCLWNKCLRVLYRLLLAMRAVVFAVFMLLLVMPKAKAVLYPAIKVIDAVSKEPIPLVLVYTGDRAFSIQTDFLGVADASDIPDSYRELFFRHPAYEPQKLTIEALADQYNLQNLYYDRYNSSQLIIELTDMNMPVEAMSQSFFAISPIVGELTKGFESRELSHQGDTLINWQRSNLALETDASGNLKFSKKKSAKKIDGLVAMVMAYAAFIDWQKSGGGNNSKFNDSDRGLLIL